MYPQSRCSHDEGSLVGMLLPRALLTERGTPWEYITFGHTEAGKPFIVSYSASNAVCTRDTNWLT